MNKLDNVEIDKVSLNNSKSFEELCNNELDKLIALVGLDNVKNEVVKLANYLKFLNKIKDKTNLDKINLNMIYKGSPGTGKTTVARIMANILYYLGYLSNNKVIETTPTNFIAGYIGQTGIKTKKLLDEHKGGLIFVDEAYSFVKGKDDNDSSFSDEAIAEIIKEMEKKETVFIFAGYDQEMDEFINLNPGIKSRIGYYINFSDYNEEELLEIFISKIKATGFIICEDAVEEVKKIINLKKEEKNFGNGRMIDNLYNKIILEHASLNYDEEDDDKLLTITKDSVLNVII